MLKKYGIVIFLIVCLVGITSAEPNMSRNGAIGVQNQIVIDDQVITDINYAEPILITPESGDPKITTIQLESIGNNIITKTIQFFSDTILVQNKNNTVSILQRKSTSQLKGRMAQPAKRMVNTPTTESEITPIPTEPVVLDETYYGYQNTTSTTPWNNYWRVVDSPDGKMLVYADFATKQVTTKLLTDDEYNTYIGDPVSNNIIPDNNDIKRILV